MKEDIVWVDYVKVISIVLVYLYHTSIYYGLSGSLLYNYYFPFFTNSFFFISGYLIFKKQLTHSVIILSQKDWHLQHGKAMFSNVIFKIMLPTVLFSCINYFPKMFLRAGHLDVWTFVRDTFLGGSLWFTCALAISELLLILLLLSRNRNVFFYFVFSVFIAVFGVVLSKSGIKIFGDPYIPWYYKSGMIALFYLCLGGVYVRIENKMDSYLKGFGWLLLAIVYFVIQFFFHNKVRTALNTCSINILGFFVSILGIFMIVYFCKLFKPSKTIKWLGRHTLGLYFLSGGIPNILCICQSTIFGNSSYFVFYLLSILAMLLAVILVFFIEKHLPFVFDIRRLIKK